MENLLVREDNSFEASELEEDEPVSESYFSLIEEVEQLRLSGSKNAHN
jgi:hypothetical protein